MTEKFLTERELAERWKCSTSRLRFYRKIGSRPYFKQLIGIRYALSEIEDIENNNISLPTSEG